MCGLFGSITHKDANLSEEQLRQRNNIISSLGIAMQERGTDSCGLASYDKKECQIIKHNASYDKLIKTLEYRKFLERDQHIILGHTRQATTGAIIQENAHPFAIGNIIGCHNGVVTNYKDIYDKAEVDSEAIFYLLDKYNNDYKKAFAELEGQFAITWIDKRFSDRIFLVREQYPLSIITVKELKTMFWCSLELLLQVAIIASLGVDTVSCWTPKTNHVYQITTSFAVTKKEIAFKQYDYYSHTSKWNDESDNDYSLYHDYHVDNNTQSTYCSLCSPDLFPKSKKKSEEETYISNTTKYHKLHLKWDVKNDYCDTCEKEKKLQLKSGLPEYTPISDTQFSELIHSFKPSLSDKDFQNIIDAVCTDGCSFCQTDIDLTLEEGIYFHVNYRAIICMECIKELGEDDQMDSTYFFTTEEYDKIVEEYYKTHPEFNSILTE